MINESIYIERLALGDHDAYRYFFMKYFPKMKYFIAHIVKSEAIAEELAQDVFEKIWISRIELPGIRSFNSYLYKMSKNIALNYLDRKYVENRYIENSSIPSYDFSQVASIEKEIDAKEIESLIRMEVEKMPEQRRKIFMMSRFENLKNEEIAQELNITKKTVENHLNLALKQLRKVLDIYNK